MLTLGFRIWFKILRIVFQLDEPASDWQIGWLNTTDEKVHVCDSVADSHWVADPFLFPKENDLFLFVEFFDKFQNKGSIAFSRFNDYKFENFEICLEEDFHLSFPRIVEIKSRLYLTVESSSQPGIRVYSTDNFPVDWKLLHVYGKDQHYVDPILTESDDEIFIIASVKRDGRQGNLCLYGVPSLDNDVLINSPSNPIAVKRNSVRNAGFFHLDGSSIRVSQRSFLGLYGFDVDLQQIRLPIDFLNYKESRIPNEIFTKPIFAKQFHTLNVSGNFIVFDFKI